MKHIKLFESYIRAYFHGSPKPLRDGTILKPHDNSYTKLSDNNYLESLMEKYRPEDKLSRYDSVFLTDNIDVIDSVGGAIDYIYEVIPNSRIEKSDLAWYTEIQMIDKNDTEKIKECVLNYWDGVPFYNSEYSAWEYRTPSAMICDLIEEN